MITPIDYAFLTFIGMIAAVLAVFLVRKRLIRALRGDILHEAATALDEMVFDVVIVDTPDGKEKRKVLSEYAKGALGVILPVLIKEGMENIKLRVPQNLPVNPQTGELDFMAPVLSKLASGKKIRLEDFLPMIMDKAMPMLEGLLGKMGQGETTPSGSETKNPFL